MQSTSAYSITHNVRDWLANSHQPRVLHVFDRACNLINERRDILSIVTPQIGNGPFNLVLQEDICFSDSLRLESRVSVSPDQLHLGNLTIQTADAKPWSPRPDWERLHIRRDDIRDQMMSWLIPTDEPLLPKSPLSSFACALAAADISSVKRITAKLAGLGAGLTPAGDDFLLGAIYGAWIIHPAEAAGDLAREIAATAAPLTTSLSAAWLKAAEGGEAGIVWHEFLNALVMGDRAAIRSQMTKLLSIGHTSGTDAFSGFWGVFLAWSLLQIST